MAHDEDRKAFLRNHSDKTRWANFEREVYETVQKFIAQQRLMLSPKSARVLYKPSYFSRDRNSKITFDVGIEGFADSSTTPSLIWPWECKDYPTRKVKVDEIEEFHAKMMQIGAGKGTVVTRLGFDSGALAFAQSKNIGLAVLKKKLRYVTCFSTDMPTYEMVVLGCDFCQKSDGSIVPGNVSADVADLVHMELCGSGFLR